jgi:hypothetical protein
MEMEHGCFLGAHWEGVPSTQLYFSRVFTNLFNTYSYIYIYIYIYIFPPEDGLTAETCIGKLNKLVKNYCNSVA